MNFLLSLLSVMVSFVSSGTEIYENTVVYFATANCPAGFGYTLQTNARSRYPRGSSTNAGTAFEDASPPSNGYLKHYRTVGPLPFPYEYDTVPPYYNIRPCRRLADDSFGKTSDIGFISNSISSTHDDYVAEQHALDLEVDNVEAIGNLYFNYLDKKLEALEENTTFRIQVFNHTIQNLAIVFEELDAKFKGKKLFFTNQTNHMQKIVTNQSDTFTSLDQAMKTLDSEAEEFTTIADEYDNIGVSMFWIALVAGAFSGLCSCCTVVGLMYYTCASTIKSTTITLYRQAQPPSINSPKKQEKKSPRIILLDQ